MYNDGLKVSFSVRIFLIIIKFIHYQQNFLKVVEININTFMARYLSGIASVLVALQ